jgi:hypothetical protein
MFKENKNIQQSLFNKGELMPKYLQEMMRNTWAHVFRENVFPYINESRFSVLYSNKASRPNSPVNVLIGLLAIKEMNGLTDEELIGSIHFDIRYQYALQTENLERQPISINSFTNFRNRLVEYEKETGFDLVKDEIEALSHKFTGDLEIDGKKMRMDSVMISSNCKKMSRLELVYRVIEKYIRELSKVDESLIMEEYKVYLEKGHQKEVIYQIRNNELDSMIEILLNQAYQLYQQGLNNEKAVELESFKLLERLISEQVIIDENDKVIIKEGKDIKPNYLQSSTDPDATYRKKYKDNVGYVANVVESYDTDEEGYTKGIITNYEYEQNTHSDIDFAREVVKDLSEDKTNDQNEEDKIELSADGGYFEQDLVDEASNANIEMYFTNLVGRKPNSDKLSCTLFKVDEAMKKIVRCPHGVEPIRSHFKKGAFLAHFKKEDCETCPLKDICLMKEQKKSNVVRFREKTLKTERIRKFMDTKEYKAKANKRAAIEGVPSVLRRKYDIDRMPSRGLVRSKLHFGFKILAMNIKSLQKGLKYMDQSLNKDGILNIINEKLSKLFKIHKILKSRPI